jgi:hypothetical protein
MSMPVRVSAVPMILIAALTACGGGGGGGSVHTPAPAPAPVPAAVAGQESAFTSFSAITPNRTVVMSGVSQTGSGTDNALVLDPADGSNSTVRLTYDADRNFSGMSFSTPQSITTFGPSEISEAIDGSSGRRMAYVGSDGNSVGWAVDPVYHGWNYQSFGVWMKEGTPFRAGAISAGAVTPGSAVPTISSATFTGHANGLYFNDAGHRFITDARMSAVTDFDNRSIQFSTSGTMLTDLGAPGTAPLPNSNLNLSGTLNYAAGSSQFSGDVKTQNSELAGKANGRFFGPSAQEIGGVYGLGSPTGSSRMIGGFGGKR